jgi:hypothetical protein
MTCCSCGAVDRAYCAFTNGAIREPEPTCVMVSANGSARGGWPAPLSEAAYHGVTGKIVKAIMPQTEADPAAIIVQFLVAFGCAAGRNPGFRVEADNHHTNLFAAVVGESALARKGSSLGQALAPICAAQPDFATRQTVGLSSGEGLIFSVRDPVVGRRKPRKGEVPEQDGMITDVIDEGVRDKRLLVAETELASVLSRLNRDGNSLSPIMRQAWDGQTLRTLTKGSTNVATDPHVAVIGHITADELQAKLTSTENLSGFSNRFLWTCARRSKSLPRGGTEIYWRDSPEVERIQQALAFANRTEARNIDFGAKAGELWDSMYEELTTGRDGLVAAVTSRATAQTRRLATIYAILDCCDTLNLQHLQAGMEVWRYCQDSAAFLFGDASGDQTADVILAGLRTAGRRLRRSEVSALLNRNVPSVAIDRALGTLLVRSLVRLDSEPTPGGGPPTQWLEATT